jgi:hypothetical protein
MIRSHTQEQSYLQLYLCFKPINAGFIFRVTWKLLTQIVQIFEACEDVDICT